MKKKIILGLALSTLLAGTAMAATTESELGKGTNSQSVIVSYDVGEFYTVKIPADFVLTTSESTAPNKTVTASNVRLETGKKLTVTMTSENYDLTGANHTAGFKVKNGTDSFINYTVKNSDADVSANGATILTVASGTETASTNLKFFTSDEEIAKAKMTGKHTDKLTFACSVSE